MSAMKNKKFILFVICVFAVALSCGTYLAYASGAGSKGDPIALKSYVDSRIAALDAKLTGMIQGKPQGAQTAATGESGADQSQIGDLIKAVELLKTENESLKREVRQLNAIVVSGGAGAGSGSGSGGSPGGADGETGESSPGGGMTYYSDKFTVLEAYANQKLILGAGTEMVLRTGKALAIRGEYGGLIDLASGKDLDAGASIPTNHMILSSRDDNRGAKLSENSWILVKGGYSLR